MPDTKISALTADASLGGSEQVPLNDAGTNKRTTTGDIANLSKGLPLALTGAVASTRYVGGTATGAPASGTFVEGDFVVTQAGQVYVCTTAGTPGTWTQVGGGVGSNLDALSDVALTTPITGQVLAFDGTNWIDADVDNLPTATDPYKDAVVVDSPIVYWRLDAASGTVVDDYQNAVDLTHSGGVTVGVSPLVSNYTGAKAATYNGSTGMASSAAGTVPASLQTTGPITIECWVQMPNTSTKGTFVRLGHSDASTGSGFVLGVGDTTIDNNGNNLVALLEGVAHVNTAVALGTGVAHVVWVHNGTANSFYVNGSLVASPTTATGTAPSAALSSFNLGGYTAGGGTTPRYSPATIDEVAIYASVLSGARVSAHYAARLSASSSEFVSLAKWSTD